MNDSRESPSQWEWYWKLFAVVAFLAVMGVWSYALRQFIDSLPEVIILSLTLLMIGFFTGAFIGKRIGRADTLRTFSAPSDRMPAGLPLAHQSQSMLLQSDPPSLRGRARN